MRARFCLDCKVATPEVQGAVHGHLEAAKRGLVAHADGKICHLGVALVESCRAPARARARPADFSRSIDPTVSKEGRKHVCLLCAVRQGVPKRSTQT